MTTFRLVLLVQLPDIDPELLSTLQQVSAISLRAHQRNIQANTELRKFIKHNEEALTAARFQDRYPIILSP